jgi:hypothetical protein
MMVLGPHAGEIMRTFQPFANSFQLRGQDEIGFYSEIAGESPFHIASELQRPQLNASPEGTRDNSPAIYRRVSIVHFF